MKINSLDFKSIDLLIYEGKYFDINKNILAEAYFINKKGDSFLNSHDYKRLIFKGLTPPHQTTLFKANSKIMSNRYNDDYKIAGDLEFFCSITKHKKLSILNFSFDIIQISTGGVSDTQHLLRLKDYKMLFKIL